MNQMSTEVERQILDRLTTIEVMLRGALDSRDDHEARLRALEQITPSPERIARIEDRQRSMDAWRWKVTGMAACIAALLGTGTATITANLIGG